MMLDWEFFLLTLYVTVDDFCQQWPTAPRPGPAPALSPSETVTLALLARFARFTGERDFYRWAERHLRAAFPRLPHRSQFNRQVRRLQPLLEAFALHLARPAHSSPSPFEALDRTGIATRNSKRRGRGWLPGQSDLGFSNRTGWFHGFSLLVAAQPEGVITGWGFGPGSAKDQPLAEALFAARSVTRAGQSPCTIRPPFSPAPPVCLGSAGLPSAPVYLADKGFQGRHTHQRWHAQYGAEVIAPPQARPGADRHPWPKGLRRVLAGMRQIIETVFEKLEHPFTLLQERPHTLGGFAARLAARIGIHNFCIRMNQQLHRPLLAFADLLAW